jgi:hypothetical protein
MKSNREKPEVMICYKDRENISMKLDDDPAKASTKIQVPRQYIYRKWEK